PNLKATEISCHVPRGMLRDIAKTISDSQLDGTMDRYMDVARALCAEEQVPVCDCYKKWQTLKRSGVNTTELLSNYLNHPTREMNWMFAYSLVETFFTA
ncbi:MAG: GDSL family lipase, partial [Clostridiales bacterium]|nr:GDSL family lipase [Clostridiales bacterium]